MPPVVPYNLITESTLDALHLHLTQPVPRWSEVRHLTVEASIVMDAILDVVGDKHLVRYGTLDRKAIADAGTNLHQWFLWLTATANIDTYRSRWNLVAYHVRYPEGMLKTGAHTQTSYTLVQLFNSRARVLHMLDRLKLLDVCPTTRFGQETHAE